MIRSIIIILMAGLLWSESRAEASSLLPQPSAIFDLKSDNPGRLAFFGSDSAELFAKELNESFKGVLALDYVSEPNDKFPLGFLNASPIAGTTIVGSKME